MDNSGFGLGLGSDCCTLLRGHNTTLDNSGFGLGLGLDCCTLRRGSQHNLGQFRVWFRVRVKLPGISDMIKCLMFIMETK